MKTDLFLSQAADTCCRFRLCLPFLFLLALSFPAALQAAIPEPGLILYGVIRQDIGGTTVRKTVGQVSVTIVPPSGSPITVTASLANINDQFSYCLEVPFASVIQGMPPPTDALMLAPVPLAYSFTNICVNTSVTTAVGGTTFTFSQVNRGGYLRFDLVVTDRPIDSDGDGLPDDWENYYFFGAADPNADNDEDGLSNLDEYLAGTHPIDPGSCLRCLTADPVPSSGFRLTWSSEPGRYYRVERSQSLTSGFLPIATGLAATPPENLYLDPTPPASPAFYRVVLE